MPHEIELPSDDSERNRHQFYYALASALENNTTAMVGITDKLEDISTKHAGVAQQFRDLQVTIKTIAWVAAAICTVLGGATGMLLKEAWGYTDRVTKLERNKEMFDMTWKQHEPVPDQLQALKGRLGSLEDELSDYKRAHP
jgi:hypothetical protein